MTYSAYSTSRQNAAPVTDIVLGSFGVPVGGTITLTQNPLRKRCVVDLDGVEVKPVFLAEIGIPKPAARLGMGGQRQRPESAGILARAGRDLIPRHRLALALAALIGRGGRLSSWPPRFPFQIGQWPVCPRSAGASLVAMAKLNGVEPLAWLTDVLERMVSGRTKAHELERLLPWAWKVERLAATGEARGR
jgi:hypothetical protein